MGLDSDESVWHPGTERCCCSLISCEQTGLWYLGAGARMCVCVHTSAIVICNTCVVYWHNVDSKRYSNCY